MSAAVPVSEQDENLGYGVIVGINGSLRGALQQAKAAIRYPQNPLNFLISAKSGCDTTSFVNMIHRYAVQNAVLRADVPLVAKPWSRMAVSCIRIVFIYNIWKIQNTYGTIKEKQTIRDRILVNEKGCGSI